MQMRVVYMEIGLHFPNATEMQCFRTIWGVARRGNNREEIAWLSELCIQDLLPKSYTYRHKQYQWSLLESQGYNNFCSGISTSVGWDNKVPCSRE